MVRLSALCIIAWMGASGALLAGEKNSSRLGIAETPLGALLPPTRRGDFAELARVVSRIGVARMGEALFHSDPAIRNAALAGLPLLPNAVLLLEKLSPLLLSGDGAQREGALRAAARILANHNVERLAEWEVTRESVAELCKALLLVSKASTYPSTQRVWALRTLMDTSGLCPAPNLEALWTAQDPELRRAAIMLYPPYLPLARLQGATQDPDQQVAAAAGARLCRDGKPLPESRTQWRRMALAKETAVDDLLDIVPCLLASPDPSDRVALTSLRKHPNPSVREAVLASSEKEPANNETTKGASVK